MKSIIPSFVSLATVLLVLTQQQQPNVVVCGFSVPTGTNTRYRGVAPSTTSFQQYFHAGAHPWISTRQQKDFQHGLFSTNTSQQQQSSENNNDVSTSNQDNKNEISNLQKPSTKGRSNLLLGKKNNKRKVALSLLAVAACFLGFVKRQELVPLLPDPKALNQWLRKALDNLNQAGNTGLAFYATLFCLWTMTIGITTPVETAAGFAFGAQRAIVVNALGKTVGALVAFFLGRFIFYKLVQKYSQDNEILQLVEESITEHPLLVALMVRLSPLPEPVKNMGMSVLDIKSIYFILSVLIHGFPFTCLWSCMGAETAKVVTLGVPPSKTLKILVSGSTWFGVILSPSLIGWWLNSLRTKKAKRQAAEKSPSSAGHNDSSIDTTTDSSS